MRALPRTAREASLIFFVFLFFGVLVADRLSKILVLRSFGPGQSQAIWPGVFHLTRVDNTGAAFGLFKGQTLFLAAVASAFLVVFLRVLWRQKNYGALTVSGWCLTAAGAAGNLADRLRYGYVIDFLDLRFWPVFNVADISICTGVGLILLASFKKEK